MFLPQIGTRGIYTLLTPFDTKPLPNVQYKCTAVRELSEIIAAGESPYGLYYKALNISIADYTTDVANKVCIVTLQAESEHVIYVPASYISGYPEIGGVGYLSLLLGAELGPVKIGRDLTFLTDKVKQVITENLGIVPEVKLIASSLPLTLSASSSATLEAARLVNINNATTDYTRLQQALADNALLVEKVNLLEQFISSKNL